MKIEPIRKKLAKLEPGTALGPFEVDIEELGQDPTFQVRQSLHPGNLDRLKSAYKSKKAVAPITVALIPESEGGPVVVDGHHRVTALETIAAEHRRAGVTKPTLVNALFVSLTAEEARWQAAQANMAHGQPLNRQEVRKAFQRYVEAGQHRELDGTYKSYRAVAREFGKTHPTIRSWMVKDFPCEARKMQDDSSLPNAGGTGVPAPVVVGKHKASEALRSLSSIFDSAPSYERAEMIEALRSLLDDLERAHARTNAFDHDQALRETEQGPQLPDVDF